MKLELEVLKTIFGVRRKPDGFYYSYREFIENARIPGVLYKVINDARRYFTKLGNANNGVDIFGDEEKWPLALELFSKNQAVPECFMHLDRLNVIQDDLTRNRFYALTDRNTNSRTLDIKTACEQVIPVKRLRNSSGDELRKTNRDVHWMNWPLPPRGPD